MLLLYDVQRVGAGDAVELRRVFTDSSILRRVDILVAQLDELTTASTTGDVVFLEVADVSRFFHSETSNH